MSEIIPPGAIIRKFFKGFVVAIIGADGARKSTIAGKLRDAFPLLMKYIYMGASTDASNFALPTSRLLAHLKRRRIARFVDPSDRLPPSAMMS